MQSFHLVSGDEGNAEVPCTGDVSARTEPSTPGDPIGSRGSSLHCICLRGCPESSRLVGQWTNSLDQLLLNPNSGDRADPGDPTNVDIRTQQVTGSNVSPASLFQHSQCPLLTVKNPPFLHQHSTTWNYTPCLGHLERTCLVAPCVGCQRAQSLGCSSVRPQDDESEQAQECWANHTSGFSLTGPSTCPRGPLLLQ